MLSHTRPPKSLLKERHGWMCSKSSLNHALIASVWNFRSYQPAARQGQAVQRVQLICKAHPLFPVTGRFGRSLGRNASVPVAFLSSTGFCCKAVSPDQQQNVMMDGLGIHVCVTGATGYLAGHIVKQLLERQYTVHATCRDPNNMKAVQHLLTLPNAAQLLKLYQADLLCPGSFGEAITGCKYVIHTASPYMVDCSRVKAEEIIIKPAVNGTENVLSSVTAAPTVERVVLTSSTAAVFTDAWERGKGHVFTEADWNVSASPTKYPYFYSKKCAEQKAYQMCKEAGGQWSLCSINPGAIWGPPLSNRLDGESINQCIDLLSGMMWPFVADIACGFVDVRDVARAHIAAMENPSASGRYLVNARSTYLLMDAMKILRKKYPQQWVPIARSNAIGVLFLAPLLGLPRDLAFAMLGKCPVIDASKAAHDLGMTPESYITQETTISEMAEVLMMQGMVPRFKMPVVPVVLLIAAVISAVLVAALYFLLAMLGAAPKPF